MVDSTIWLCVYDLCQVMCRPMFMTTNPVQNMCTSARKIKFDKDKDALWAILRSDIKNYFYLIRKESSATEINYKRIVSWADSLTPEMVLNAPGVTHRVILSPKTEKPQEITVYKYNNHNVSFLNGEDTMVNATEMANAFNKSPNHWLRNSSTKEYIATLAALRNRNPSDLVKVTNGDNGGTWVHKDVAIELARWLSPTFAIWCNDRITELLNHGITAMPDTIEKIIANPTAAIQMLQALQKERTAKEQAIAERDEAQQNLSEQQPKADYYDAVIESRPLYTTAQIAGELGMCYLTLRKKLAKLGVVTSDAGETLLTPDHLNWGEMVTIQGPKLRAYLKWNKIGRENIFALINPNLPT